jgi:2-methylcitrate dehydratase
VTGASQGAMSCQQGQETRSVVERIAAFAVAARPERLTPEIRRLFKRNILDSLACAIAALPGRPFAALRDQFEEYRAPGRCTLIGGGKTSLDQAALFNSGLTRYVDLLDSYMSPGGLAHPSDNFGTVLAAAEYVDASGEDFMLALAVAYEIQCRFTAVVPVMTKGFNHALQLAMSTAAQRAGSSVSHPSRSRTRFRSLPPTTSLSRAFIEAVLQLDARPISDLMDLLAQVRQAKSFPTSLPGLQ